MNNLDETLKDIAFTVNEKLGEILPKSEYGMEARLFDAMRYSTLSPGKRLRPFMTVVSARLFGVSDDSAYQTAAAIELIHSYSLVHDDLPAMDDDDMRRGRLSTHKKYDEATAILTGDALLTMAFEVLAERTTHSDSNVRCELIQNIAKAAGARGGMVAGQMMDILSENTELSVSEITRLQRMKTGMLFATSCEAGAILGKAPQKLRNALRGYAHTIGLAFQITDDLLDFEGVEADNDYRDNKSENKATLITALGYDKAKEQVAMLADQSISHLDVFTKKADLLRDLARFIINRDK